MDILKIEKFTVMAIIGINDWEKKCFQRLVFDLELSIDAQLSLKKKEGYLYYLDYNNVISLINQITSKQNFLLIEHVAETIAENLMRKFFITWIRIKVSKPDAIRNVKNVSVIIERKNRNSNN